MPARHHQRQLLISLNATLAELAAAVTTKTDRSGQRWYLLKEARQLLALPDHSTSLVASLSKDMTRVMTEDHSGKNAHFVSPAILAGRAAMRVGPDKVIA